MPGRAELRATWLAATIGGRVSRTIGGAAAAHLWFTPWRLPRAHAADERERMWLGTARPLSMQRRGLSLAGFVAGEGPTVLLVHGWGQRAAGLGAFVAPLVAAGCRVVGLDLPAHGRSPGRRSDALVNARAVAAAAESLEGIDGIVAHSLGAHAAVVALSEGLEAQAAALIAPAVRVEHAVEKFRATYHLPPRAIAGLRRSIERRYGTDIWTRLAADALVRGVDVPALVVHDRDDRQIDHADAELLTRAWSAARLVTTTGLGHMKIARDDEVVATVAAFIAGRLVGPPSRPVALFP